jgi:hypothetical protein
MSSSASGIGLVMTRLLLEAAVAVAASAARLKTFIEAEAGVDRSENEIEWSQISQSGDNTPDGNLAFGSFDGATDALGFTSVREPWAHRRNGKKGV